MVKFARNFQVLALVFLLSAFFVGAISTSLVKAQAQATIDVLASVGGSTDPTGTTTYSDGTVVTLTATPGEGFFFVNWEIVTASGGTTDTNNPTTLTVSGGVTYAVQAIFAPDQTVIGQNPVPVAGLSTAAIVVILPTVGGATSPAAGTYALANAASFQMTAMPTSGFVFDHWVIGGSPLNHGAYSFTDTPTDNPYTVDHGYGNTYTYQAVFKPTSSTVPEFSSAATIVVALALVAMAFGTYAYKRKK